MTANSLVFIAAFLIIYIFGFRFNTEYSYSTFKLCKLKLAYLDVLIPSILICTASYKSYIKKPCNTKNDEALIEDLASVDGYEDIYHHGPHAKRIARHILASHTEQSFGIAVLGPWGSGKTDFLLRLEQELNENEIKSIVISFNPWKVKAEGIIEEFFDQLAEALKPFNQSVVKDIREYSKKILQPGKEIQYRIMDTLIQKWTGSDSVSKRYGEINKAIAHTGRRIVVLIDDMDRLSGKEIMEVFRLIRNTANFSNTFFVVGMDQQYMVDALTNAKEFANEGAYMKKIFQLNLTLPAPKKEAITGQAEKLLLMESMTETEIVAIRNVLGVFSKNNSDPFYMFNPALQPHSVLDALTENFRDLKRFCNSFRMAYLATRSEVDLLDLFILELIKNRNLEIYNLLRNRTLLKADPDHSQNYIFDEQAFKNLKIHIPTEDKEPLKDAIELLLQRKSKNSRRFSHYRNFYLYFAYNLFDQISFGEFRGILDKETEKIVEKFNEWSAEGKSAELHNILEEVESFGDETNLKKIVTVYLTMAGDPEFNLSRVQKLLFYSAKETQSKYFNNDIKRFQYFILSLIDIPEIDVKLKALLLFSFLRPALDASEINNKVFTDARILQKELFKLLLMTLREKPIIVNDVLTVLYRNSRSVGNDRNTLMDAATRVVRCQFLKDDELFAGYLQRMIRPSEFPYNGWVVLEPFFNQIFPDRGVLVERINGLSRANTDQTDFMRLKQIILTQLSNNKAEKAFSTEKTGERIFIETLMLNNGVKLTPGAVDIDLGFEPN
jgi:hypothetical protein